MIDILNLAIPRQNDTRIEPAAGRRANRNPTSVMWLLQAGRLVS